MGIDKSYINFLRLEFDNLNIPKLEMDKFESILKVKQINKNDFLVKEGDIPDKIAFVISGLFRAFYITPNGDEKTIVFREKGRILSSYSSYIKNEYSKFSIESLEDSMVLYITIKDFENLLIKNDCWKIIKGNYFLNIFIEKEARERELLSNSAKENYIKFLKDYPGLIDRINHYYIASYLGITNVSLSRIRKENQK